MAIWRLIRGVLACAGLVLPAAVHSQTLPRAEVQQRAQEVDHLFNWYYASVYGTGTYRIGEERVGVLRVPLSYTFQKADGEHWGIKLTVPVSAALVEFDLSDFDLGKVRATGLTVLPGIEVDIPVSAEWTLRPFLNVGGGWEFQRDSSALIYSTGVSTAWRPSSSGDWLFGLGGKLVYAGYAAGSEKSILAALSVGGDVGKAVAMEIYGRQAIIGAQFTGTVYFNDLEFLLPASGVKRVAHELELALTLGVRKPIEVLGVSFDRIGLGYRQGSNGLRGVRLVGSSPF